jgi:hypothetical protein
MQLVVKFPIGCVYRLLYLRSRGKIKRYFRLVDRSNVRAARALLYITYSTSEWLTQASDLPDFTRKN